MVDFFETVKQWKRMCAQIHSEGGCNVCGLKENDICGDVKCVGEAEIKRAEKVIRTWAADHPEPVYPTWYEWLCNIGLLHDSKGALDVVHHLSHNRVPADIAQKLDIEPRSDKDD